MTLTAFVFYEMITPQAARKLTYFMLQKLYFIKMKCHCLRRCLFVTFLLLMLHSVLGNSWAFYNVNGFR